MGTETNIATPIPNEREALRAAGRRRLEIASKGWADPGFKEAWGKPGDIYPFAHQEGCWLPHVRYMVDDYEAEIGYFIDLLGFNILAFGDDVAMFRDPESKFCIQVSPPGEAGSTNPETLSLEFMVTNPIEAREALKARGVVFEKEFEPWQEGSTLYHGTFHTPHGVLVNFWGMEQ